MDSVAPELDDVRTLDSAIKTLQRFRNKGRISGNKGDHRKRSEKFPRPPKVQQAMVRPYLELVNEMRVNGPSRRIEITASSNPSPALRDYAKVDRSGCLLFARTAMEVFSAVRALVSGLVIQTLTPPVAGVIDAKLVKGCVELNFDEHLTKFIEALRGADQIDMEGGESSKLVSLGDRIAHVRLSRLDEWNHRAQTHLPQAAAESFRWLGNSGKTRRRAMRR